MLIISMVIQWAKGHFVKCFRYEFSSLHLIRARSLSLS